MSDAAITSVVTGLVSIATMVVGFLTLWVRLRYGVKKAEEAATTGKTVEQKLEVNTKITKDGATAAGVAATAAAGAATIAAQQATNLAEQFNGKMDERITAIVDGHVGPVMEALKAHAAQDERGFAEIRQALLDFVSNSKLKEFSDYVHQRNHDVLNAVAAQTLKVELVLRKLESK